MLTGQTTVNRSNTVSIASCISNPSRRLAAEVAAMRCQPPIAGAVTFALVPSEAGVDCVERLNLDVRGAPDAAGRAGAIDHNHEVADFWRGHAAVLVIAEQRCSGSLCPGDNQGCELGRHLRAVAERDDLTIRKRGSGVFHEFLPERLGSGSFRRHW